MEPQDMAAKAKKLPFKRRVQNTIADLFTKGDLVVPDECTLPSSIDKRKNALVEKFYAERRCIGNLGIAYALKQAAEAEYKRKKTVFCEMFNISEDGMDPGYEETYIRDDVSVLVKVNNPQQRIDRETLRKNLITDLKMSSAQADAFITKSEKEGKPPVFITPAING